MKKLGCASCGGTKKMAKGGTTKNVNISKPGAGYAKRTVGGDNQKMNMYGIAQTGQGQMDGKTGVMKKGGMVKKMQDGGGILTPDGRIKSNKTRNLNLSGYGDTGSVSRNKRNGDVVTRTTQTSNGYAGPTATKTKTISNKEGDTISEKTKNISPKTADRKINRVINNVGRNANDTYNYKKGGAVKKPLMKAQSGTSVKTKPIPNDVYKRDSTNYSKAADLYLNANTMKEHNVGRDSLNAIKSRYGTPNALEKRMKRTVGGYDLKKKGGVVKSKKK